MFLLNVTVSHLMETSEEGIPATVFWGVKWPTICCNLEVILSLGGLERVQVTKPLWQTGFDSHA